MLLVCLLSLLSHCLLFVILLQFCYHCPCSHTHTLTCPQSPTHSAGVRWGHSPRDHLDEAMQSMKNLVEDTHRKRKLSTTGTDAEVSKRGPARGTRTGFTEFSRYMHQQAKDLVGAADSKKTLMFSRSLKADIGSKWNALSWEERQHWCNQCNLVPRAREAETLQPPMASATEVVCADGCQRSCC